MRYTKISQSTSKQLMGISTQVINKGCPFQETKIIAPNYKEMTSNKMPQ